MNFIYKLFNIVESRIKSILHIVYVTQLIILPIIPKTYPIASCDANNYSLYNKLAKSYSRNMLYKFTKFI